MRSAHWIYIYTNICAGAFGVFGFFGASSCSKHRYLPLRSHFGLFKHRYLPHRSHWALKTAARACWEAAKTLKITAQACTEATKALKITARAGSEATKSLDIAAQACSEATKAHQNRCSSLLHFCSGAQKWRSNITAQSHCSKMLVSVSLSTVPLCPALLRSVHGYARVHTSIYIYIHRDCHHTRP